MQKINIIIKYKFLQKYSCCTCTHDIYYYIDTLVYSEHKKLIKYIKKRVSDCTLKKITSYL